jgi:hypothetical protein
MHLLEENPMKRLACAGLVLALAFTAACQSPTEADSTISYEDIIDVTANPTTVVADSDTGGRTYRIVRGNNQPDDILGYDWHAGFDVSIVFNSNANDDDVDIEFPVQLVATSLAVKQASGGIITTPTGSDTEHYEYLTSNTTSNQITGINSPLAMHFEIWYDLPSLRKEAVIQLTFTFTDDDGASFQRVANVQIAP